MGRITDDGGEAVAIPTNLAEEGQVEAMVRATVDAFGGLDLLVNNAAVTFVGDLDIALERHDLVMEINLRAPLLAVRAALPHLRASGAGRILNISSVAALQPVPGLMSYGISKLGLERLTLDLARQLRGDGIAANCFRIDVPVASEGFVANTPGVDRATWEPTEVAAEGIRWMLEQPAGYTGQLESMQELRRREGIMASRAQRPSRSRPPTELVQGTTGETESIFSDPHLTG